MKSVGYPVYATGSTVMQNLKIPRRGLTVVRANFGTSPE